MQGIISALLLGSLAFANLTNSNENTNLTNGTDSLKSTLSGIFPSGNVPQNPKNGIVANNPTLGSESQIRPPVTADNDAKSTSLVDHQIVVTPQAANKQGTNNPTGKIYSYQVPLNSDNFRGQERRNVKILESPSSSIVGNNGPSSLSYRNEGVLDDNVHEDFQYGGGGSNVNKPSIGKKPTKSGKDKWLFKKNNKDGGRMQEVSASSYRNHTQIQGAGSGFLQVAHPQVHETEVHVLQNHELHHHHFNNDPNQLQQIEINPEEHIYPQEPHPHNIVYNGEHDHGQHQHVTEQHHILPHPPPHEGHILPEPPIHEEHVHVHPHHHHELSAPKPLKPSIVHRDPNDHYDHHDKIRTLDKDQEIRHHHHHHGPHPEGHNPYGQDYQDVIKKTHGFEPYDYDMHKLPECAHKNKHFYNLTFCLEDHLYPLETILWALHQYGQAAHKMITDVTYQSADNLVTGLTRAEEEGYTYKHYYGANHATHLGLEQYKPPYHGYTYKTDYFKKGGYICPSDIYYGRPRRAMNTYGQWKVIVNVDHIPKKLHYVHDDHGIYKKRSPYYPQYPHKGHEIPKKGYTQTLRMEQCIYPGAPCSYIDPHFHSKCIQKHNFVRLVAWTLEEGIHVDTFKFPIACSCHIPQPIHFYQESGRHEERLGSIVPPINYAADQVK